MRRLAAALVLAAAGMLGLAGPGAGPALGCSPPFEPSIAKLGPTQVVVVGTIGERVTGGRLFHVERWFNGRPPPTPIVIEFQEGEPIGDCSYPVSTGRRLIIAPEMANGILSANLATLQADPRSDEGRSYLREATEAFGEGAIPPAAAVVPATESDAEPVPETARPAIGAILAAVGAAVALLFGGTLIVARRARRRDSGS